MSVVAGVAPDADAATSGTGRRRTHPARSSGPGRRQARTRHLRAVTTTSDLRVNRAAEAASPTPVAPARRRRGATSPAATAGAEVAKTDLDTPARDTPAAPARRRGATGLDTRGGGARRGAGLRDTRGGAVRRAAVRDGAVAVGAASGAPAAAVPEVARSWRLTRRGRAVVLGLLVALLTAGAVGFGAAQAIGASTAPTDRRVEVIVGEGDTLWSIAASVAPQGDRTETVQRIREANDLGNAHIEPGQQLVVPVPAP